MLGGAYFRIWVCGAFGEFSRKWRFGLDWVLSESRGNLVTGYLNNFYKRGIINGVGLELVKKQRPTCKLGEQQIWTVSWFSGILVFV